MIYKNIIINPKQIFLTFEHKDEICYLNFCNVRIFIIQKWQSASHVCFTIWTLLKLSKDD